MLRTKFSVSSRSHRCSGPNLARQVHNLVVQQRRGRPPIPLLVWQPLLAEHDLHELGVGVALARRPKGAQVQRTLEHAKLVLARREVEGRVDLARGRDACRPRLGRRLDRDGAAREVGGNGVENLGVEAVVVAKVDVVAAQAAVVLDYCRMLESAKDGRGRGMHTVVLVQIIQV